MQLRAAELRHLQAQLTVARALCLLLALVNLYELGHRALEHSAITFVAVYLALAIVLVLLQTSVRFSNLSLPLWVDLAALGAFLVLTPSVVAFWLIYLYVGYAAGNRWGMKRAVLLAGLVALVLLVRTVVREPLNWPHMISWVALVAGTFAAGIGTGFVGARQLRHSAEYESLSRFSAMLSVEQGLAETVRRLLTELTESFRSEVALLVFRDVELERIFVWRVRRGETGRITPENLPLEKSDAYLLNDLEADLAWNSFQGPADGFGWDRHEGRRLDELPRVPGPSRKELGLRAVMAATFEFGGQPAGRFLIVNPERSFSPEDLRWLERIVRHLSLSLENVFILRHLRARAVKAERNRMAHDLHDGVLQTLMSVVIQLDVLRRKLDRAPDQVAADLEQLQQAVRREGEELRRMVTDLRPLRVASADLLDLMRGFADRFHHEAGFAVDLIADSLRLEVPDRVCRELFQIYREALHNVKKHARANHVVVKLWQDDANVVLVVDDNGQGFSFAGRFTSDELDRLRLGPISIKERTRSVGGVLTVESNPGHGARLTVEVPLS